MAHTFAKQYNIQEGSPAYLGLARSRATSYVTHNSTNSITKFEVIPSRQPGSASLLYPNVSLDYVSSDPTISCWHGTYLEATPMLARHYFVAFDGVASRDFGVY